MKLYRTKHTNPQPDTGSASDVHYSWQGTQADTSLKRRDLKAGGMENIETEDVDVPTSKPELLAWLNANVTGE